MLKKHQRPSLGFVRDNLDADMAFSANLRQLDVFMFVSNRLDFGHLIDPDTYDITRAVPDMYQIFENEDDWEERYIHKQYPENLNPNKTAAQVS